ncbi:MAG TPA: transposase, partial [Acidobacteriota bacterium]
IPRQPGCVVEKEACSMAQTLTWIKTKGRGLRDFQWQDGYAAFSVSESHLERVRRYIACQKQHHKRMSFQDELLQLLNKHRVQYDERYLWD